MRILKTVLVPAFLVITLTLSVSIAQAESDSKEEIISPFIAQETANALIHKICNYAQLEGEGVGITWKQIQAGTPVLVHDPDYVPKYYIVPGINTSTGEVVTRIGVDAKTGEWQWYVEKCLIKTFPPVSEQQAKNIALDFMQKQRITGKIEDPYCVEMPNKKLYWAFQVSGEEQITHIYVNFENASEIFTNLDKEELRLNMPSFNPVNGSVVQPLLSIKEEQHGGQALPASHDIAMPHYYQEKSWYCGEACLQMVFDYYGPKISQDDIGDVANENPSYGTYASDLRRAAHFSDLSTAIQNPALRGYKERALGYGAHERTSSISWLSGLKQVIASDHPVIVLGWYSAAHTSGHFRVVKGYDDNLGEIITHDPWYGPPFQGPNQHFSYAYFNDLWSRNNYLGIMVSPWNVSVKCPPTVAPNTMFTVEATVEYVYNNNFFSQYTASNSQAQIHLPPGYSLAPGETQTKAIDVTVPGSSDTVSWDVVAPATLSDGDTITISAFGYITGSSYSYASYTDRIGGEGVATVETNALPIANADGPYHGYVGEPITFNGTGSYDPDGTIVSYEWDLDGDGEFDDAFGANPTVIFNETYSGNISLRVTDDKGATDIDNTTLTVTVAVDTEPPEIQSVTLDTYINIPNSSFHVTVEVTDNVGVTAVTADGVALTKTGGTWEGDIFIPEGTPEGEYTLTITAKDEAGNTAESSVNYTVVFPQGGFTVAIDPMMSSASGGDVKVYQIKIISNENFDDKLHVYISDEGIPDAYKANFSFNWTDKTIYLRSGETVELSLEVTIPQASGTKMFRVYADSMRFRTSGYCTGIVLIS